MSHYASYAGFESIAVDMKTSRFVRSACEKRGIDVESPEFQALFQPYADEIAVVKHDVENFRLFVSVNPADYLTMSYGDTWASCHILNPDVARTRDGNSYSGCYKAGCLSYMNDECTLVCYTAGSEFDPCERKKTRQLFHINTDERCVLQGRLYPYGGRHYLHDAYRNIILDVFAGLWDVKSGWNTEMSTDHDGFCTACGALHYQDYDNITYSGGITGVNTSYPKCINGLSTDATIGAEAYCLDCGDELEDSEQVECSGCLRETFRCDDCGEVLDPDYVVWIDDTPYCVDCVGTCCVCGEAYALRELTEIRGGLACSHCFRYHSATCDRCGDHVRNDEIGEVRDVCVCEECFEAYYSECDECGSCFLTEDMEVGADGDVLCAECFRERQAEEDDDDGDGSDERIAN